MRTQNFKILIILFAIFILFTDGNCDEALTHDEIAGIPTLDLNANNLKHTVITPVLGESIPEGKNLFWCISFQLAWNELNKLIKEPIMMNPMPVLAKYLNDEKGSKNDLDENSYVAMAGIGITNKIKEELKNKFKGKACPEALESAGLIAYAYLFKQLPFEWSFERFKDQVIRFDNQPVKCFGIYQYDQSDPAEAKMSEQVHIFDYIDEDNFILELKTKDDDSRLILAKIKPQQTLLETIKQVEKRIENKKSTKLSFGEHLYIPILDFKITKDYNELCGKPLVCKNERYKEIAFAGATQISRFRLDETGAVIKSEGMTNLMSVNRSYLFNKPFLIILKKKKAKFPYLALWVANPELLVKAAAQKISQPTFYGVYGESIGRRHRGQPLKYSNISLKCHGFLEEAGGCFRFECIFLMLLLLLK